jgi:catechol 2,3-dioxygenase-like lactoylglutathione lyase family enzyme
MFAHVSIGVSDFARAKSFYNAVMPTLGYGFLFGEGDAMAAYGVDDSFFIINTPLDPARGPAQYNNGGHICFKAPSPNAVQTFYQTALDHGGVDAGPPGLRPHYSDDYYAAFVFDPDGHKIEAMTRIKIN